jgi:hypothetical protein
MVDLGETKTPNRRLDSWKEIAAFFARDERTVKRWEKERGLPVHRLQDGARGPVHAFTDELVRWMKSPVSTEAEASTIEPSETDGDSPAGEVSQDVTLPQSAPQPRELNLRRRASDKHNNKTKRVATWCFGGGCPACSGRISVC